MKKNLKPLRSNNAKNKQSTKFGFVQKFLILLLLLFISFTILPAVIVLFIGLLPTITTVIVDTKNLNKITIIGCSNITGVMICLNNFFNQYSNGLTFSIQGNIFNIIIMLSAAAVGMFLYYIIPDLFAYIFKNSAQHRLKNINAKLEKLKTLWDNIAPEKN